MTTFGDRFDIGDFYTDHFTGDGTTTTFTLTYPPAKPDGIEVVIANVVQDPAGYSTNNYSLVLSAAPTTGATIWVRHKGLKLGIGVPGTGTTDLAQLASGTLSKLQGLKNVIIGGDFGTNPWQRGTSLAGVANSYTADRWQIGTVGTLVATVSKQSDAPTVAQASYYTDSSLNVQVTTADASIATTDECIIEQHVEGYNFRTLAQRPMVFSFWVKAFKTGTYCVSFRNAGADRSYVAEYTINQSATWEKKTVTISASPSAGTWDYTNGIGLMVAFALSAGTNFQTTANTWNVGNYLATSNQVNATDSTNNYFRVALVQLEAGSTATPFEARSVQQELQLCQRYYQRIGGTSNGIAIQGYQTAGSLVSTTIGLPVSMRIAPSLTVVGSWSFFNAGAVTIVGSSTQAITIGVGPTTSGVVDTRTTGASTYIDAACEL